MIVTFSKVEEQQASAVSEWRSLIPIFSVSCKDFLNSFVFVIVFVFVFVIVFLLVFVFVIAFAMFFVTSTKVEEHRALAVSDWKTLIPIFSVSCKDLQPQLLHQMIALLTSQLFV